MENTAKCMEDLISQMKNVQSQTDDLFEYPLCNLLGLDKQLRSIRGSLKVEVAERFSWKKVSRKKSASSRNSETILESMTMAFEKTS